MLVNELLTYAIFCFNGNGIDKCKKIMIDFYNDDEIKAAKRSLWITCENDLKKRYQDRNSTNNRTAAVANLDDIMDAIKELDAKGKLPECVARDISRVPDRQPEELNMLYVISQIAELKKASKTHEECLSKIKIEVMELQDEAKNTAADHVFNESSDLNEEISVASTQNETPINEEPHLENFEVTEAPAQQEIRINEQSQDSHAITATQEQVPPIEGSRWGPEPTRSHQRRRINNNLSQRMNSGSKLSQAQQRDNVLGSANTSTNKLEGAPLPQRSVFVSRVKRGDVDSMKMFLKDNNVDTIDIIQTNHSEAKFKSFKIILNMLDSHKVLKNNFWPSGILCKKWREPYHRNNSSDSIDYANDY